MSSVVASSPYSDSPRPEMLAFVPGDARRVLDVGCHTGAFGRAVKNKCGAEVWGIEPDPQTAEVAATALDRVINDFFSPALPLPDHYFDVIVFNDVLEHMTDPWAALKLAASKLKPTGCVIVSIPNLRHIDNLVHIMRERDFNYEPAGIRDRTHLRFFTRKSALRLFDNSGLSIVTLSGVNEECYPSWPRRIAYFLFKRYLDDTRHIQFAIVAKPQ
ncbi:class I SAM-dependent methyltransferase [Pseudoduganella sp. LjRoot289]|uniref:class I SAM-dependent methyltransferase n=1 Tax=Pseudoduganella sp. LjRoot289 TaxID=3342314 RepID=UPI003ECE6D8F